MKEEYLHFLWRMRFLPSRSFILQDGSALEIVEFGEYNKNESGPDFFHAKLIVDGLMWFGHIEFHLKSSDWYKHKHDSDSAYDHVILHVVWEDDKPVYIGERRLPTLILSEHVTNDFSENHKKGQDKSKVLPCTYAMDDVPTLFIEREKEKALTHRLSRKTAPFQQNVGEGFAQIFYELLATAFGAKVNRDPFWQLTKELPILRVLKMSQAKRKNAIMATSGMFEMTQNQVLTSGRALESWQLKRKGLHPKGAPERRVEQFAQFVAHFNFDFGFMELSAQELITYIREAFKLAENPQIHFTKAFQDLILINAFVPFFWWIGEKRGEEKWQSKAIQLLERLPAEQNHLIKFLRQAGFEMQSAYDSQALLELYALRCSRKKCLSCAIGNKILNP